MIHPARPGIVLLLAFVSISQAFPWQQNVHAVAQNPSSTISVGDWWTYNLQNAGVGITGSLTLTLSSIVTLLVNGVPTTCYKETESGSGNLNRNGITGTFTTSGTAYIRQSDLAAINNNITVVFNAGFTLTQITYSNTSTPVPAGQFPLYVGETWKESYLTTNKITTFTSVNPTPTVTTTNNATAQVYTVTGSSVLSVSAGSYLAYDVHSTNATTGSEDQYYSPQVDNIVKDVSYYPNGTVKTTLTLQDFNAWAYQTMLTVNNNGATYNVGLMADATISNQSSNSTSITFQVNATDGTSGRANVAMPVTLNNTNIRIYVDNNIQTPTQSKNSTYAQFFFTFGLSTHTVTLVYSAAPASQLIMYIIYGGIGAVAAALVIAALLIFRRRAKPSTTATAPTEPYPPPTTTPQPTGPPP